MKFERIIDDLRKGENVDLYVTIIAALVLVALNLFSLVSQALMASVTLAVLALITVANLGNRHRIDSILYFLRKNDDAILEEFPLDFVSTLEVAKEVWLTGVHHSSIMSEHFNTFERMIRRGGSLKVMVVEPDGAACAMTAMRFAGNVNAEQERTRTRANLNVLKQLAQIAPDRVQIKVIDYLFEYNTCLVDPTSPNGRIYVQRYTFRNLGGARKPKFIYHPSDRGWYDLIRSEVFAFWECGLSWPSSEA